MKPLSSVLTRLNIVVLPDHAQCKACGYFDLSNPEVVERLKEAGRSPNEGGCKCKDRKQDTARRDQQRWANSNLPHRAPDDHARTLDTFQAKKGLSDALRASQDMAMGAGSTRLTLVGSYGTGKTHLLEAIGREWLHRGKTARYEYVPDLVDELRAASSTSAEVSVEAMLEWRAKMGLLLLDDIGQRMNEFAVEKLTQVIDERFRTHGALVVATNYASKEQLAEASDYRLADRVFGRAARVVYLEAEPYEVKT